MIPNFIDRYRLLYKLSTHRGVLNLYRRSAEGAKVPNLRTPLQKGGFNFTVLAVTEKTI